MRELLKIITIEQLIDQHRWDFVAQVTVITTRRSMMRKLKVTQ